MKTSESTKNLNLALFGVQGEMKPIKRNAENEHFSKGKKKATYTTWDDLAEAVIPVLQKNGILMEMEEGEIDGYKTVTLHLTHVESGEWKQYAPYRIKEASTGNLDHNAGKSTTYAMKRVLILALGLRGTDEDTDGNDIDPPKKQTSSTRYSSPRYEAWNKLANKESVQETSMSLKHDSLDLNTERKRFFGIATARGLTDPRMRALSYFQFKKESRSELTAWEFNHLSDMLERENDISILKMIHKAKEMKEAG